MVRTSEQLFPDLRNEVPEELEDERVVKSRKALANVAGGSGKMSDRSTAFIKGKVAEEIELEKQKEEPDWYVISRLNKLLDGDENA